MNLTNKNDKKTRTSGVASLFGRGSASKIGKSQFSRSMGGIMERLKGLSRKDLAMVGVGLSVLVAAPVAEYMMSKPADSANMLTSGFSSRESASGMASLYEPGINALSQGSADGAGEVITPLSARDPSSLILGAQPEQPPIDYSSMTGSMGSDSPDSSSSSNAPDMDDMRDSMRDAARNGASEAVKSAGAPTVIPPMGAGLRSLGMFADGGSSSVSGNGKSPITTPSKGKNLSPKQSQMVNPVASAGYKGVANTPKSGSKSGIEQLRAQGDAQGGYFSGAKAIEALDNANSVKISGKPGDGPGEGFGGGGFGHGDGYKGPQKGDHHNSHKHSGKCETLACKAAEARQKKALEWEFFWKYDLPKDIAKTFINAFTKEASDWLVGKIFGKNKATEKICVGVIAGNDKDECSKANFRPVFSSDDEDTIKSWKQDVCKCGVWTRAAFENQFGKLDDSGKDENSTPGSQYDSEFERYVADYDSGLKAFMADLASVRKHPDSKKGVQNADKAVDTYISSIKGVGIGDPFHNIFNHVANAAKNDNELLKKSEETLKDVQESFEDQKKASDEFIILLKDLYKDPEKYVIASSITLSVSQDTKNAIKKYLKDYEKKHEMHISTRAAQLPGYKAALKVFDDRIKESAQINERVHNNEYDGDYVKNIVSKLKSTKNENGKETVDPLVKSKKYKDYIDRFLTKIDGAKTLNDAMEGKEPLPDFTPAPDFTPLPDLPPGSERAQIIVKSERILCAPSNVPAVPAPDAPSAMVRVWRGLEHDFGTKLTDIGSAEDASLKEQYEAAIKGVKQREIDNWKQDSPLDYDHAMLPKNNLDTLAAAESKMTKKEFYAPGYRLVVEIPFALQSAISELETIKTNAEGLKAERDAIRAALKNEGLNLDGGNGGDQGGGNNGGNGGSQGGGDNGGNGGDQGGGNNGGNGGNQGSGILSGLDFSVCEKPNHCTREEIQKLEREASKSKKYSDSNKKEHPVWNEYMNPIKGMDQVDSAHWQEYNNAAGQVHKLRNEYDALTALYKNIAPDTEANRKAREDIKKRLDAIPGEAKQARDEADEAWKQVCLDGVDQRKLTVSKNYCETFGKGGTTNHNNTNTVVKPGNSSKPSSSKPPASAKPAEKTTLPDTLHIAKLTDKPVYVNAYNGDGKEVRVDVCHGLAIPDAGWFESDCWSYASIRNGTKLCKNITDGSVRRSCYNIKSSATTQWTEKQIAEFGDTVPPKLRKVDGVKRTYYARVKLEDYNLVHHKGGTSSPGVIEFNKASGSNESGEIMYTASKPYGKVIFHAKMSCKWVPNEGKWRVSSAYTRKEEATSSQSFGIKAGVGGNIGPVKVNMEATYSQGRNVYNFGKDERADKIINQDCPPEVK